MLERIKNSGPGRIAQKYSSDEASSLAVVIAWTGLLSMFPLILVLLALVGWLVKDPATLEQVQEAIFRTFPGGAASEVRDVVLTVQRDAEELGAFGLVGLVVSGTALFGSMANAFNRAYRVQGRGLIKQRLMGMGMILLFAVLVVASLLASAAANFVVGAVQGLVPIEIPGAGLVLGLVAWAVSFVIAFVLFLAIYRVVPNAGQRLGEVWPGALLAALLFFVLTQVFPLYVRYFGGFGKYAVFGLFFLLMIWFYVLAQVLMLGVELNVFLKRPWLGEAAAAEQGAPAGVSPPGPPNRVKRVLFGAVSALVSWAVALVALSVAERKKPET